MCSIAVFNYAGWKIVNRVEIILLLSGITVMKELTATTRAVLDQIRVGDNLILFLKIENQPIYFWFRRNEVSLFFHF